MKNEDDLETIALEQLTQGLVDAQDPERPVALTIILFGPEPQTDLLMAALEPIGVNVEALAQPEEVRPMFIHLAAGGVHH